MRLEHGSVECVVAKHPFAAVHAVVRPTVLRIGIEGAVLHEHERVTAQAGWGRPGGMSLSRGPAVHVVPNLNAVPDTVKIEEAVVYDAVDPASQSKRSTVAVRCPHVDVNVIEPEFM
jgi:hypothetical protein